MEGQNRPERAPPLASPRGRGLLWGGATQNSPDTPGSPEGNTEDPGTASSEPLLPS